MGWRHPQWTVLPTINLIEITPQTFSEAHLPGASIKRENTRSLWWAGCCSECLFLLLSGSPWPHNVMSFCFMDEEKGGGVRVCVCSASHKTGYSGQESFATEVYPSESDSVRHVLCHQELSRHCSIAFLH